MPNTSQSFPYKQRPLLLNCITDFDQKFGEFVEIIRSTVHYFDPPPEIAAIQIPLTELLSKLNQKTKFKNATAKSFTIDKSFLPIVKRAVMDFRRARAIYIESFKQRTHNPDLLGRLEAELRPLDELIDQQWFKKTKPITLPNLTSYISMQHIEGIFRNKNERIQERKYDEKFHILQAPELFLRDLDYYRTTCEIRGVPVIAAHIDIDDFKKKFNQPHGHTVVDRSVLPRFMARLEAHTHSHGYSYRYGGDEYAILIPNMSFPLAALFLDDLRKVLAILNYRNIEEKTTVSIGFCVIDSDCFLTNQEINERANRAMNFAKAQGKNCIATYRSSRFEKSDLYVLPKRGSR